MRPVQLSAERQIGGREGTVVDVAGVLKRAEDVGSTILWRELRREGFMGT